jgi:hypothetical protein
VIFDEMRVEKPSAFHAQPSYSMSATTEKVMRRTRKYQLPPKRRIMVPK